MAGPKTTTGPLLLRSGWCTPGSGADQHAACRVENTGTGVHQGRLILCSCDCDDRHTSHPGHPRHAPAGLAEAIADSVENVLADLL